MKVNNILQSFKVQLFAKKQVDRSDAADKIPQAVDKVQISAEARSLQRTGKDFAVAKQALRSVPDVRENRIAEVKAKLKQGVYSKPDFSRELASRLTDTTSLQKIIRSRTGGIQKPSSPSITQDRQQIIQQVRERVTSGFYNKPEILSDTADRLLKNFGI